MCVVARVMHAMRRTHRTFGWDTDEQHLKKALNQTPGLLDGALLLPDFPEMLAVSVSRRMTLTKGFRGLGFRVSGLGFRI